MYLIWLPCALQPNQDHFYVCCFVHDKNHCRYDSTWLNYPVQCNANSFTSICSALLATATYWTYLIWLPCALQPNQDHFYLCCFAHDKNHCHRDSTWLSYAGNAMQIASLLSALHYLQDNSYFTDQTWLTYFEQCDTRRIPSICVTLAVFTVLDLGTLGK